MSVILWICVMTMSDSWMFTLISFVGICCTNVEGKNLNWTKLVLLINSYVEYHMRFNPVSESLDSLLNTTKKWDSELQPCFCAALFTFLLIPKTTNIILYLRGLKLQCGLTRPNLITTFVKYFDCAIFIIKSIQSFIFWKLSQQFFHFDHLW